MKKKLTLRIDEKILTKAKKMQQRKDKISLSSLVEAFLLQFISENS